MKYMLDTVIFNRLVDGRFSLADLPAGAEIFVTHIQRDELGQTPDVDRRGKLLAVLAGSVNESVATEATVCGVSRLGESRLSGKSIPTSSMVWDVSNWDESCFPDDGRAYEAILKELRLLDPRRRKEESHIRDALIAETAAKSGITMVTADHDLATVMEKLGSPVLRVK